MKKLIISILAIALILSMASCELVGPVASSTTTTSGTTTSTTKKPTTSSTTTTATTTTTGGDETPEPDDVVVGALEVYGLNEMIDLSFDTHNDYTYSVYYKEIDEDDSEYILLDNELMIANGNRLNCYILGISAGVYKVKIEAQNDEVTFGIKLTNIEVLAQDRSGFAHFGASEGVGAYNNDGTLKEGTKVIYVTNENKNTVTCEINGTEYIGLVNILRAQYNSDTPMLIRIIGKITTNQWNYKNVEPRLADGSNSPEDFFENTFSTEYGENLANLIVKMNDKGAGQTYKYKTTPEGIILESKRGGGAGNTTYKGSDFPELKGKSVYDDDSYYNMLEVSGAKNITIEGIGSDAEIFQFGIGFEKCNNIEIKNLTFTGYPEDALNFLGEDRKDLANYSRYWIHNCTFNRGYNAWDISGERDKYAGDGTIDFNNVSGLTLAYNYFNNPKKTMLFGSDKSEACMNMTMHHNYFYKVESRIPLGRNVNIHSYNNYFEECKNCSDLRNNSYMFSENNYYKSCANPAIPSVSIVKSFGDIFDGSSSNQMTVVTKRDKTVSILCKPDSTNDLGNFDTNSELFYYDSVNKKTDVSLMLDAEEVPEFVIANAGAGKSN